MPFNDTPDVWLPDGYTLASNEVRLKTATAGTDIALEKLTDAQANGTTGDIRQVFRALCFMMADAWASQSPSNWPTKMKITKSVSTLTPTTTNPESLREVYSFTFDTVSDPGSVIDEP